MTMFSYDLDRSSKIPKIFHNFVLFYRILNYWNNVNKRVVDEFFEVLYLEKTLCLLTVTISFIDSPDLCRLSARGKFSFFGGDLFNREGDLILFDVDLINFSHQTCSGCKNFIFIDFKKVYPAGVIRRIYDGFCAIEKECAD